MHQCFKPAAWRLTFAIGAVLCTTMAHAQSRGELLYSTHCISCHTSEIHWRDNRAATSWSTLRFQVDRWQGVNRLEWTREDVDDVARYLNETIYHYPKSTDDAALTLSSKPDSAVVRQVNLR